jgi:uncharacterized membrane protein
MQYVVLKSLHILSVVLFLGNIITGVFWKFHGDRVGTLASRAQALEGIISSDRWFTNPGVFLIIGTGVALAITMGYSLLGTPWILWAIILFAVSGFAFGGFVAPLQKRLLANVRAGMTGTWNEPQYKELSRRWEIWGVIATLAPVIALVLMVMKPG